MSLSTSIISSLVYAPGAFFFFPWKPAVQAYIGDTYEVGYKFFRRDHSEPTNVCLHLVALAWQLLGNFGVLNTLDAKMFGAYWCSHCYEQKQRLGKEAFANVQYNECSKEGLNSRKDLCKEKNIPGYPTWEINGKLFPGDMYLDELEDIITNEKNSK